MMNTQGPLVSIGIPAYKTAYLARAIDSCLGQTYGNLEVVIVNDCSPHDVGGIVGGYDDPRIRYFKNDHNLGASDPGYNWNECLRRARGEFFCLLCDDDMYEPTFVEELLGLSRRYPGCNVFHSSVKVVDAAGRVIQHFPKMPEWESCASYIVGRAKVRRKQTISEWMLRRSHAVGLGGYANIPLAWGSDYISMMRFSAEGGIASTDEELAVFSRNDHNITMQRQGQCETKVRGTAIYYEQMRELVLGNDALRRAVPLRHLRKIRDYEFRATLLFASPGEFRRIAARRKDYGISALVVAMARARRAIRKLSGRR